MLSLNLRMPPFTPSIRLPRKPTGSLMISPTTLAALASTLVSIEMSPRIVLMTALIAPIALSTRPLFSACNSSIRSSRPLRASTYLVARVSTTDSCLASTSLSSCWNRSPISCDASAPTFFRSAGRLFTYDAISALPVAIRCFAATRSLPTMSATREMTPSICLR